MIKFKQTNKFLHDFKLKLIDIKNSKECWFQCLYNYSIFYKTPKQILNNPIIIGRLSSLDACLVGVVCGEVYKIYLKNKDKFSLIKPQLFDDSVCKWQIQSINRNAEITYTNNFGEEKKCNIIELAKNHDHIENFSPQNAFYIGFLAGLELYKIKNNLGISDKKPCKLRLVYSRTN